MNRRNLTAAVLAGLAGVAGIAGTAQAVNINPDGLGQVLIYPYYTTNAGNQTLLSVVNTTGNAKAVKVRFMESLNTREVLDFNLYLSKYDVWTAALYSDDGTPTLVTRDTTCTVPYIYAYDNLDSGNGGKQAFLTYALGDGGPTDISRTAEGHFEMIEMATIVNDMMANPDPNAPPGAMVPVYGRGSATAATHTDGFPNDCQQLVDAWTVGAGGAANGYWVDNRYADTEALSGGMFGGAAVVNVAGGAMYSYDPTALNNFATAVLAGDPLHQDPGTVLPSLNSGDVYTGTVFLANGVPQESVCPAGVGPGECFILPTEFDRGVDAVSYVFMRDSLMNEYTKEAIVNADSEWVITFPTKHFYTFSGSKNNSPWLALDPFTGIWYDYPGSPSYDPPYGDARFYHDCEVITLEKLFDREEAALTPDDGEEAPPVVSPAPPPSFQPIVPFELCYETNVIRFGSEAEFDALTDGTEILGATTTATNIDPITSLGFEYGWAKLGLDDFPHDANGNGTIDPNEALFSRGDLGGLEGLPVTGFAVSRFQNGELGGVLANYGGIWQHKYTRKPGSSLAITP